MTTLDRKMTRLDLMALVINTVMGADALGLPGRFYTILGRYSVWAWIASAPKHSKK